MIDGAAAASRLSVPRVRSSFVATNCLSGLRRLRLPASAVIWCTITSGPARYARTQHPLFGRSGQ